MILFLTLIDKSSQIDSILR